MAAKTAVEVAEMESELYLLRREKAQAETQIALLTQERDACRVELAIASARAREEMIKSAQLETIISQTSMGLVSALRSYHEQKHAERAARMAAQERELGVGGEDTAAFLQRRQDEREEADDRAEVIQERRPALTRFAAMEPRREPPRAEQLRAAAEAVRPPLPAHLQPAKDHPLLPPLGDLPVEETGIRRAGDLRSMVQRAIGEH